MVNISISEKDTRLCNIKSCYEYTRQNETGTGMHFVNPLEFVLQEGNDVAVGFCYVLPCSTAEEYAVEEYLDVYTMR